MKHKYYALFLSLLLLIPLFSGCKSDKKEDLKKIRLNEVVRSVFYAPMYAAINEGFFKEEGLDIDLSTGQGADKTMQQVLSKNADIGFCGPEQVIYIFNQKRDDYPVIFAQLTQRDGSLLISRKSETNFKWESLKGKTIIGGRPGGVPEMALEYVLRNHGLKPGTDVKIITNIALTAAGGAFKGGTGDYAALFEPTPSMLAKDKAGTIVASIGESAGVIPYTCFFSTKSYMDSNPEIINKFTRAIYKGQLWIAKKSDAEVAKSIKSFFPGTDEDILVSVIKNYREINAFSPTPQLNEDNMNRLMDIIQSYNSELLPERPPFKTIATNKYADEAVEEIKK